MIDRDIHLARALLVESNALLRSVTAGQLRDLGIGAVTSAARVKDARLLLEREPFDIVLCNREFEGSDYSGQDLLDELRREHLLPHGTVFLMVVHEASYAQVMEAAEAALDGFIVRPYTAATLGNRLMEARARKRELGDVLKALDAGQPQVALMRAVKRFQEQQPYALYCGRLAAELLLTLDKPVEARKLFERLVLTRPEAAWARLGLARAMFAAGNVVSARNTVAEVLKAEPQSADAHDLMGRLLVDRCDFDGALVAYRAAATATPGCLLRAQHAGALAFYQGQGDDALKLLDRTLNMGVQSKLFDPLTLVLLTMLRFDRNDAVGMAAVCEQLKRYRQRFPNSRRLARLEQTTAALTALLTRQQAPALAALHALSADIAGPHFDLEAANLLLALCARVPEELRLAGEHTALVDAIARRFCTTKATAEVLMAAARRCEPAQGVIRAAQARITGLCEQAMKMSLSGQPAQAVRLLLAEGKASGNVKLLETASSLVRRHADGASVLDDDLAAEVATALAACQPASHHIAGIQRSGRAPGSLQLRGAGAASAPAAAAPATATAPAAPATAAPATTSPTTAAPFAASPATAVTA